MRRLLALPVLVPVLGLLATGCSGSGGSGGSGSGSGGSAAVAVTAGDTTCAVARTTWTPGTTTLNVKNTGSDTTEVYVYASDGTSKGEVEDIAPGTSRNLVVDLPAGTYQVACKPGQKGDGIRTTVTVTGSAPTALEDPRLSAGVEHFHAYVQQQSDDLLTRTAAG